MVDPRIVDISYADQTKLMNGPGNLSTRPLFPRYLAREHLLISHSSTTRTKASNKADNAELLFIRVRLTQTNANVMHLNDCSVATYQLELNGDYVACR